MYLEATAIARDIELIKAEAPELWRSVRRFNRPVQLAVAAAVSLCPDREVAADLVLISLAPCCAGSPEIFDWARKINARHERTTPIRANPTHTLHAVDNLALSAVAMLLKSRGRGIGLGGSAGQAWEAIDIVLELGADALVFAGDQSSSERGGDEIGVALRLSATGGRARIERLGRETTASQVSVVPHAAAGLSSLLAAIDGAEPGPLTYRVPASHTDGLDVVTVELEVR